jgi:hypothetical protein
MQQMKTDRLENDLLNQLAEQSEEVYALRTTRGMRTYSRVQGKIRVNVPPVYKVNRYPFFSCVSRISIAELDPDNIVGREVITALDRACTTKR